MLMDIEKKATVLTPADNSGYVMVQAGIIKTRVPQDNLKLLEDSGVTVDEPKSGRKTGGTQSRASRDVHNELDLRGQSSDEALMELDRFIDEAVMSGVPTVTVIHGKGTGALRTAVHAHLRKHRNVRTFRLGVYGEGESGVSVVEIK